MDKANVERGSWNIEHRKFYHIAYHITLKSFEENSLQALIMAMDRDHMPITGHPSMNNLLCDENAIRYEGNLQKTNLVMTIKNDVSVSGQYYHQ